jgi:hypothetical protein
MVRNEHSLKRIFFASIAGSQKLLVFFGHGNDGVF